MPIFWTLSPSATPLLGLIGPLDVSPCLAAFVFKVRLSNHLIYLLSWSDLRINENIFLRTLFIFQAFTNPKQPTSSMLLVSKSEAGPMGLTRATAQALSSDRPPPMQSSCCASPAHLPLVAQVAVFSS